MTPNDTRGGGRLEPRDPSSVGAGPPRRIGGLIEIGLTLALVSGAAYPAGAFVADVFANRRTFLTPLLAPIERTFYPLAGIDPEVGQKWPDYVFSMVLFGATCLFGLRAAVSASLSSAQSAGHSRRAAGP